AVDAGTFPGFQEATDGKRTGVGTHESAVGRVQGWVAGVVDSLYRTLGSNRITRFPWAVIQTFSMGQGALLSGSMAYYTFLSLLPLLMVGGFVLGTLTQGNPAVRETLVRAVEGIFPGVAAEELLTQLIRSRVAFGVVGLVTVAYAATGFVGALTASLNRMWEVGTGRNPLGQKLLNLLVVVLLGVVLMGSVTVTIWVGYFTRATLGRSAAPALRLLQFLSSPVSLLLVLLLLYSILPARKLKLRSQLPGAVFGAVAVEVLKRGFAFWARHSAGVSVLPRSVLSVVLLLVWLGFLGQAILYGAALNVVVCRRREGRAVLPEGAP
ncbi:MAG: YihY/virulence factor BrkB family protein, partial [Acidimicrobiia bacterium]